MDRNNINEMTFNVDVGLLKRDNEDGMDLNVYQNIVKQVIQD